MNLVIDIGNSSSKLAVYSNESLVESFVVKKLEISDIENLLARNDNIRRCILSSVKKKDSKLISILHERIEFFLLLDHNTSLPIRNLYKSKSTLGYDRIASAVGANKLFPDCNLLIIDVGTAITIDIVSADNAYLGGNISPGLSLRFRSLHEFTDNLPLVHWEESSGLMGIDTDSAILSGVLNGIIFELQGYIDRQKLRYSDLKVLMTGGDAKIFDKKLKNSIFVDSNLNLFGLHRILDYNAEG
jgi:type III pantothenate kinase